MKTQFNDAMLKEITLSAATDKKRNRHVEIRIVPRDGALSDLSFEKLARMAYLYSFTDDTRSVYTTEKRDYLTKKETIKLLGGSERYTARIVNQLIEAGKLIETDDPSQIFIGAFDKAIFEKPRKQKSFFVASWLIKFIYSNKWSLATQCGMNPVTKLGALLRLLPYVNWRYNIICENPEEKSLCNINPIGVERLTEIVPYPWAPGETVYGCLCEIMSLPDGYFSPLLYCKTEYGRGCFVLNPEFCQTAELHWSVYSETQFSGERIIHDADYMTEQEDTRDYDFVDKDGTYGERIERDLESRSLFV